MVDANRKQVDEKTCYVCRHSRYSVLKADRQTNWEKHKQTLKKVSKTENEENYGNYIYRINRDRMIGKNKTRAI